MTQRSTHVQTSIMYSYIHVGTGDNVCEHDIACVIPVSFICLVGVLLLWLVTKASHLSILCVKQAMCPWPTGATSRRFSRNTQILGREQLISIQQVNYRWLRTVDVRNPATVEIEQELVKNEIFAISPTTWHLLRMSCSPKMQMVSLNVNASFKAQENWNSAQLIWVGDKLPSFRVFFLWFLDFKFAVYKSWKHMTQKPSNNQSDWSDWSDDRCHFCGIYGCVKFI